MSPSTQQTLATHGWWLASRASGVVALVMVTVSVAIGLVMAGKLARRPGLKRGLIAVHEQAAVVGLVAIGIHGVTLLGDPWLNPGVNGLAVPFAMAYRPLFAGLGVVAGYAAALLGLSFYARRRIGTKLWRKAHRATTVVWVLGVVHALGAGSDASAPWLRYGILGSAVPIAILLAIRMTAPARVRRRRASGDEAASLPGPGTRRQRSFRGGRAPLSPLGAGEEA